MTSLMGAALAACAATPTVTVKSPLSAVPPAPGMILLRDQTSGGNLFNQGNALPVIVAVNLQDGQVLWRYNENLPSPQIEETSPVLQPLLQGGLIYVPENYAGLHGGNAYGELVALDPATGQARWRYKVVATKQSFETGLYSEPVEANGVVYLTAYVSGGPVAPQPTPTPVTPQPPNASPHYFLVQAVDSHTGALLWSHSLSGDPSSPDVAGDSVIVLANDGLTALRTSDGSIAWTFKPGGSYGQVDDGGQPNEAYSVEEGPPGPLILNHLVLVDANSYNSGNVSQGASWFAVSASTGKLVWQSSLNTHIVLYSRPVLNQSGDVLCTSGSNLQAPSVVQGLSTATGKTLWNHSIDSELSMCGASDNVFYLSERNQAGSSGGLLAFDSHSGTQLWQTATARPGGSTGVSAPQREDGLAAIPAEGPTGNGQYLLTGPVTVIQLNTGKVLWQQDLSVDVTRPILVVDNLVLIAENSTTPPNFGAQLIAYSLQAGSRTWTLQLAGS